MYLFPQSPTNFHLSWKFCLSKKKSFLLGKVCYFQWLMLHWFFRSRFCFDYLWLLMMTFDYLLSLSLKGKGQMDCDSANFFWLFLMRWLWNSSGEIVQLEDLKSFQLFKKLPTYASTLHISLTWMLTSLPTHNMLIFCCFEKGKIVYIHARETGACVCVYSNTYCIENNVTQWNNAFIHMWIQINFSALYSQLRCLFSSLDNLFLLKSFNMFL